MQHATETSEAGLTRGSGAVGGRLGELFHIKAAPSLVTTSLRAGPLAVTEIQSMDPVIGMTDAVPTEEAFLLCLQLEDLGDHQVWEDGRALPKRTIKAGEFILRDLTRSQAALIDRPHHSLHFYLPRAALDEMADNAAEPHVRNIDCHPGEPRFDSVVRDLANCLVPTLASPEQADRSFIEHVLMAIASHVSHAYGGVVARPADIRGGLARWQLKRAQEMLSGDLTGNTPVASIARECRLSVQHFARAFKKSTGLAPHRWLIQRRVETAKVHLANRSMPLAHVALLCGFADQSHMTRVFGWHTGLTPAAWRRQL
ncbi:AraC family transcriptional regulator [Sphingomonas sp. BN140010]|uniref:AraC family transcriptional regulator n=1 Tax=Sphingomonas arvum TaxID=2992113 RepID=A0ABT3JFQ4_9SPHN|nr:AraC family transcriptional regulator [Sphingomonas sp. BN140010]MCW3797605.1 AraC family transcriptional regulator [Sphingomonas sp. BN140010]